MQNSYEMQNDFLKYVMEGMGVQPSDNMLQNWDTIMNFVPTSDANISSLNSRKIKLVFSNTLGGNKIDIDCTENMPLKEALIKFGMKANISEEELNKCQFLCEGKNISVKTLGTIAENNLKNGSQIVLVKLND